MEIRQALADPSLQQPHQKMQNLHRSVASSLASES
uniref:Uncharacterized protein n=1 Tax=Arundo donax TaxID=35708 RepID=A0A0A8ZF05_ARUDO